MRKTAVLTLTLLVGCASTGSDDEWHPVLDAQPREGKALLFLYTWGAGNRPTYHFFAVDEKHVETLEHIPTDDPDSPRRCEFTVVELDPGPIVVSAHLVDRRGHQSTFQRQFDREMERRQQIDIEANDVYFARSQSYHERKGRQYTMGISARWVVRELAFEVIPRCRYVPYRR